MREIRAVTRGRAVPVLFALFVGASMTAAGVALADDSDRGVAERIVADLTKDTAHEGLLHEPIDRAKVALEKANAMRSSGDDAHARVAEGVAREWAEMGRELVRAADLEERAYAARRDALDAGAQVEREHALLEEAIARVGRARAQLDAAEAEHEKPEVTAHVAGGAPKAANGSKAEKDKGDKGDKKAPAKGTPAKDAKDPKAAAKKDASKGTTTTNKKGGAK